MDDRLQVAWQLRAGAALHVVVWPPLFVSTTLGGNPPGPGTAGREAR